MKIGNITGILVVLVQFLQVASWCNNPDTLQKNGWKFHNGELFKTFDSVSNTWFNHSEWENYCQQYGGSLLTIKNANENAFAHSLMT
ncbi:hypothetical protein ACJMK2_029487 [Sinanodonta woodiana]|uniref:C-type lectin domain-containing protein n=1 Tax=Sinanodonta woodiana TaxID=1069815 RepID=A0ABD3XAU8_SINWO